VALSPWAIRVNRFVAFAVSGVYPSRIMAGTVRSVPPPARVFTTALRNPTRARRSA